MKPSSRSLGYRDGLAHGGEVDGGARRVGPHFDLLLSGLAHLFAAFARFGELAITLGMDGVVVAEEFVVGRDVTDGAMEARFVVTTKMDSK